jgi:glycosyltransferase involved in cell wall biosynthesis
MGKRIGILTDYARVTMLTGPVFMTQFFKRELEARGYSAQIIGPDDPDALPGELPDDAVLCPALTFPHYKGYYVPMPFDMEMFTRPWELDLIHGQTNSLFLHFGVWLREYYGIPLLATNTIHLPSYTQHALSDQILQTEWLRGPIDWRMGIVEKHFAEQLYNNTDGIIVLSRHLVSYWRDRGVTAPIHVIPRPVRPEVFDRPVTRDPFPGHFRRGHRILTVCRHAREKCVDRVVRNFAAYVEPNVPDASLTLVGDGPSHEALQVLARQLGVADKVHFAGSVPQDQLPDFYRNADVFAYASLSETFGCVVSEALWSGLPVVAFDDGMGVAHQVRHEVNGSLIPTQGFADRDADIVYGRALVKLMTDPFQRRRQSARASQIARFECSPERIMRMTLEAYEAAKEHRRQTLPKPASQRSMTAKALCTWRHVQTWSYQNASFWMIGQFFRSRAERVPDVLGQAVKISSPAPSKTLPARIASAVG